MKTPTRNWQYSQMDVNVLFLAFIYRVVATPLLYELLPLRGRQQYGHPTHPHERYGLRLKGRHRPFHPSGPRAVC
jgi:hypothetical protein